MLPYNKYSLYTTVGASLRPTIHIHYIYKNAPLKGGVVHIYLSVKLYFSCIKLIISALHFKKLVMSSSFDYFALFKHHNGV